MSSLDGTGRETADDLALEDHNEQEERRSYGDRRGYRFDLISRCGLAVKIARNRGDHGLVLGVEQ